VVNPWDLGCFALMACSALLGYANGVIMHSGKWLAMFTSGFIGAYVIQLFDLCYWQRNALYSVVTLTVWVFFMFVLSRSSRFVNISCAAFINKTLGAVGGAVHAAILINIVFFVIQYHCAVLPAELSGSFVYHMYKQIELQHYAPFAWFV